MHGSFPRLRFRNPFNGRIPAFFKVSLTAHLQRIEGADLQLLLIETSPSVESAIRPPLFEQEYHTFPTPDLPAKVGYVVEVAAPSERDLRTRALNRPKNRAARNARRNNRKR